MSVTTRHTTGRARTVPDRGGAQTSARPHTGRRVETGRRVPAPKKVAHREVRRTEFAPPRPPPRPRPRPRARTSPTRPRNVSGLTFQRRIRLVRIVLVVALLFMVARLVDVQIIHSGTYQADARNESHHPTTLSSLRGGIYAAERRAAGALGPDQRRDRRQFPNCAPPEDSSRAFPAPPHSCDDARSRAPSSFGVRRVGQGDLAERRTEDRG